MKNRCFQCVFLFVFISSLIFSNYSYCSLDDVNIKHLIESQKSLILLNKRINFKNHPYAFNPSLAYTEYGLLMTFRYVPDPLVSTISYIGIVRLDEGSLDPISEPQILNTREVRSSVPSQAEDARIFCHRGKVYVIYNDQAESVYFSHLQRRDIFIAEVCESDGQFTLINPLKLYHSEMYPYAHCQKNWVPFEWNGLLLLGYAMNPYEILYANLTSGKCKSIYKMEVNFSWLYGALRGGTPGLLVDGEYLAFFHSSLYMKSFCSSDQPRYHYFMGAYTFSSQPPFHLTKMMDAPIVGAGLYTSSDAEKRVIFPGGIVYIEPDLILVAYGKDDREVWIAVLDKNELYRLLKPVID